MRRLASTTSLISAALIMAACATLPAMPYFAQFEADPDPTTRDIIRTHIRIHLGGDYIADMSRLVAEGSVIARDRGRSAARPQPRLPVVEQRFVLKGSVDRKGSTCWLVAETDNGMPPLRLDDENCVVIVPT